MVEMVERDVGALARECERDFLADPVASCARDQRLLRLQAHCIVLQLREPAGLLTRSADHTLHS
jgi:hypothetical protein